jgi:hypothetical protein
VLLRDEGPATEVAAGGPGEKSGKMFFSAWRAQRQDFTRGAATHTGIVTQKQGEESVDPKAYFLHYPIECREHAFYMVQFMFPVRGTREKSAKNSKIAFYGLDFFPRLAL